MKQLMIGFAAAWIVLGGCAAAAEPAKVGDLSWISGRWMSDDGSKWTEENWSSAKGGVLLGNSKQGSGSETVEYELLRISPDQNGVLTYWASPGGRPPTPFALTTSTPNYALFENPKHDYPTRIEYRRDGDKLTATISGPGGANPMSWRHTRVGN